MEKYKQRIKTQCVMLAIALVVLLGVQLLAWLGVLHSTVPDRAWDDRWRGFIAGAAAGLTFFCLVGLVINLWGLHDEKVLKKQFIRETDERTIRIIQAAQSTGTRIFVFLQLLAVIVSGYFNATVSLTCLVCLVVQALILCGCKLYWHLRS